MLIKTTVFTALVGFAFTVNSPTPVYAATSVCVSHKHTGTGRGPSKKIARYAARQKWRYGVLKHKHLKNEVLWSFSVEQSSSCRRKYGIYTCKVQSYPCIQRSSNKSFRKVRITSVGFTRWCKRNYRGARRAGLIGRTAGDWVCLMKNGSRKPISVVGACKGRFGIPNVLRAKARNWNDPNSWECYVRKKSN